MTNENSFDRQIKDSLFKYSSPVPSGLWEKIESDKRLKKSIPFWRNRYFLSAIVSIIVISLITGYFYKIEEKSKVSTKTDSLNKLTSITQVDTYHSKVSKSEIVRNDNIHLIQNSKDSIANKSVFSKKSINKEIVINNVDKVDANKVVISPGRTSNSTDKVVKIDKVTVINSENNAVVFESLPSVKSKSISFQKKSTLNQSLNISEEQNVNSIMNSEVGELNKKVPFETLTSVPTENDSKNDSILFKEVDFIHLESGKVVSRNPNFLIENNSNKILKKSSNVTVIHVPDVAVKKWYIDIFGSPDLNTASVKHNIGLSAFAKALDSSQRITNGFSVGTRIERNLGEHWKFKTGLQYKQVNERFFYVQQTIKNVNVVTNRSYTDNLGSTVYVADTASYQQSGYTIKTVFNSYKSIEIPLIMGWEGRIDKLRFGFNSGLITTLYTFYQGKIMDTSSGIVPLGSNNANGFYHSVPSFSLYGSADFIYPIKSNVEAFAEPYCRFGLSDNINSSIGYSKRFNSVGVFLGLRYRISSSGNK